MRNILRPNISILQTSAGLRGALASYAAMTGLCVGLVAGCWDAEAGHCGNDDWDKDKEECDDGFNNKPEDMAMPGDCTDSCKRIPLCGNSMVEGDEGCDEGPDGGATCTADCMLIPQCGNGKIEGEEKCDDGNPDIDSIDGDPINLPPGDALHGDCTTECKVAQCGDNVENKTEECDGGNTTPGDGCSASCKLEECGNGVIDPNEDCDDSKNGNNDDGCNDKCELPFCGDGFPQISLGEQCDLGDLNDNAGLCTLKCQTSCGDDEIQSNEECDNGDANGPGKACKANCTLNVCGDGDIGPGEACDDENDVEEDACPSGLEGQCKADADCRDGFLRSGVEECDDGNDIQNDNCSNNCWKPRYVFITSAFYSGDMKGVEGADAKCQTLADEVPLSGTYKAWLTSGDAMTAPAQRFKSTEFKGWYRMPTDPPTLVAQGWSDLTSLNEDKLTYLRSAIHFDENKADVGDGSVWTNTTQDGEQDPENLHCDNWSSNMGGGAEGRTGRAQLLTLNQDWTAEKSTPCNNGSRLYCFQVSD